MGYEVVMPPADGRRGVLLNSNSRWRVSAPLPPSAALPLREGETRAKRARGSLTHHLECIEQQARRPWLDSFAAPRLKARGLASRQADALVLDFKT
jgi:hypothetical protein